MVVCVRRGLREQALDRLPLSPANSACRKETVNVEQNCPPDCQVLRNYCFLTFVLERPPVGGQSAKRRPWVHAFSA